MAHRGRVGFDRQGKVAIHDRIVQSNYAHHKKHLESIKGRKKGSTDDTLDNSVPYTLSLRHIREQLKKNQLLSEREEDVNRGNSFLLHCIARGKVDNMEPVKAMAPKAMTALPRCRLLEDITKQNEFLASRLVDITKHQNNAKALSSKEWMAHEADHIRIKRQLRKEKPWANRPSTSGGMAGGPFKASQTLRRTLAEKGTPLEMSPIRTQESHSRQSTARPQTR
mmetsp:Transcript_2183/g.4674  ORF Transcript_2183/g.4674 Transcript_2183/m.4674 type:complete len:224 (+) Transcript_2183:113-784(+)